MMKKIWILFCLALLAATCALVCACTDVTGAENKHDHIYSQAWTSEGTRHWHACVYEGCTSRQDVSEHTLQGKWQVTDCTQGGTITSVCTVCGYSRESEVAPQAHVLVQHEKSDPTCTQAGWEAYENCTMCSYTTFHEISPLGHDLHDNACTRCNKSLVKDRESAYGYRFLGTLEKGEAMQQLYARIDDEVRALHTAGGDIAAQDGQYPFACVGYASLGLTPDEAAAVWKTYKDDNPLYFWLSDTLSIQGEDAVLLAYEDYALTADRAEGNALIDARVTALANELLSAGAYDAALFVHDRLISGVDYSDEQSAPQAHNVIGALEGTGTVCEGYARTFQLLLDWFGVENLFVTGAAGGEEHAWNLAKMDDGQWYWFDLTNDDTPRAMWGVRYDYFCETDAILSGYTLDTSSNAGVDFLYDLPARAQRPYADGTLDEKFSEGGDSYAVVGYDTLLLSELGQTGDAVIPERVEHGGREYRVVCIGRDEDICIQPDGGATSLQIPSSVEFIWDRALVIPTVEQFLVAEENAYFTAADGVLFTRNKTTLVAFPGANRMAEYVIPDETAYIAFGAFDTMEHLQHITFGENVMMFGVANWGAGYPDPASRNGTRFFNTIAHEMENLLDKLSGENKLTVSDRNEHFTMDGVALYKGDEEGLQLEYIFDRSITTFHFSARVRWLAENGWYLFNECKNLQSFTVDEDNPWLCEREGIVYTKDLKRIVCVPRAIRGSVTVPEGVTALDGWTFRDCALLERVTLPSTLTSIQEYAFLDCTSLVFVNVPQGVTKIGKWAFASCTSLSSISLPEGLVRIDECAFSEAGLDGVTLPEGLEEIGEGAFRRSSIRYAYIPGSVRLIGYSAFRYCERLVSVGFLQPADWQLEKKYFGTGEKVSISAEALAHPDDAAAALKDTYSGYIWRRADET